MTKKKVQKNHSHLQRLYREELQMADAQRTDGKQTAVKQSMLEVMSPQEWKWLRRDMAKSFFVTVILLLSIGVIAAFQDNPSITSFASQISRWGGF